MSDELTDYIAADPDPPGREGQATTEERPDGQLDTAPTAEPFRWDRATPAERQTYSARRARQDRITKGLPPTVQDKRMYDKLVELFR